MKITDIFSYLDAMDRKPQEIRNRAIYLQPRTPGGTKPWNCLASDQVWYVVKCQNNPQDERMGRPLKFLTTDLVCSRLGQLFNPPICPGVEVIDVPYDVARLAAHPPSKGHPIHRPVPGPSFGSRLIEDTIELKMSGPDIFANVKLEQVARLITFQTWLRGVDVSALVTKEGKLLSIDHGYYLTVYRWDDPRFGQTEKMKPKIPSQFQMVNKLHPSMFTVTLEELMSIPDTEIVSAFSGIPNEWGVSLELRAKAAAYVLSRRSIIQQAIFRLC